MYSSQSGSKYGQQQSTAIPKNVRALLTANTRVSLPDNTSLRYYSLANAESPWKSSCKDNTHLTIRSTRR